MDEFNELNKVIQLFDSVGCRGNENNYFIAYKDMQKSSGFVNGMEYPYDALLINQTDTGIGFFYLKQPGIPFTLNIAKMNLDKNSYTFIPNSEIKNITVKNAALLNSKSKRISIDTTTNKSHKLLAKIVESTIPYQTENFTRFINKYSK